MGGGGNPVCVVSRLYGLRTWDFSANGPAKEERLLRSQQYVRVPFLPLYSLSFLMPFVSVLVYS